MQIKTMPAVFLFFIIAMTLLSSSCSGSTTSSPTSANSTQLLPTWIAQTVSAGALQTQEALDLPSPSPTLLLASSTPTPTRAATATLSAMGPSPTPSLPPTFTSTPLPTQPTRTAPPQATASIPAAAVQIRRPGPLSRLISPIQVQVSVRPGPDGRIRIELLGEDGRLLIRKIINYGQESGWVFLTESLEFEISAAAETARLVISTYDNFGRLAWLQAQDVILLSMGQNDINPPGNDLEPVIVQEPTPNKFIQGGTLILDGLSNLPEEQPLLIELISATGKVVGYRQAFVEVDPEGEYTPFQVEIPYTIEEPTWVRLTVKQHSTSRIPGLVYTTSFEVLLSP